MRTPGIVTALVLVLSAGRAYSQFTPYLPPASIDIRDIDVDDNHTLFIATDKGVVEFTSSMEWRVTTTDDGLPSNDVLCVEALQGLPVYVGTANKGIAYRKGGTTWTGYTLNTAQTFEKVDAISILPGQDTIIGTDNGKFFYLSATGVKVIPFSQTLGNITAMGTIYPPGNPDIRYATSSKGNGLYVPDLDFYFNVNKSSSPLPSDNVLCSASENEFVYDGTDRGIYTVDFKNPQQPDVKVYKRSNSGLPSDTIQCVAVQDGVQWYGTPLGLVRYDGSEWDVFTTKNAGLSDNNIKAVAIDGDRIIVGTGDGRINIAQASTFGFGEIPGVFNFELFPNPSAGRANLSLPLKGTRHVTVTLYTIHGKTVQEVYDGNLRAGNNQLSFDLSHVMPGTYLCGVKVGDYMLVKPLVIIH